MAVAASLLVAIGAWGWVNSHESARPANSPSIVTHQPASQGPIAMISAEEIETIAGAIGAHQRVLFEEVSDQLRPVTTPFSAVLHTLRRSLPRSEAPARSS